MLGNIGFTLELINMFLLFKVLLGYSFRTNRSALAVAALLAVFHYAGFFLLSSDMLWELNILWKIIPVVIPVLCFQGRKLVILGIGLCMDVVFLIMEFLGRGTLLIIVRGKIEKLDNISTYAVGLVMLAAILACLCFALKSKRMSLHESAERIKPWAFLPFLLCKPLLIYDEHYSSSDIPDTMAQMSFGSDLVRDSVIGMVFLAFFLSCLALSNQRKMLQRMVLFNEKCIREQTDQYQLQGKTDMELRKFRHDHKEHFAVIRKLAEADSAQRVLSYLDEINVVEESLRFISTNNVIGDAIFNRYESLCREAGIFLSVDGKFPDHLLIAETDLCIILSNGLKNAYDAARKCRENRGIEVSIENDGEHFLFLWIRNSCCESLELRNSIPVTNSEDKRNHGLGTRNMTEAARRAGGSIIWREENGQVVTEIMIPV